MLRELGPENPIVESRVAFAAAAFFLLCGLNYKRLADYAQKRGGHSDRVRDLGITIMRPFAFLMSGFAVLIALMLIFG